MCGPHVAGMGGGHRGHAEVDRTVLADDGDRLLDLGAFGGGQGGDVAFDPVDEPPDPGDFLVGGGGVGAGPLVDTVDGGGEPFPGVRRQSG